jgi:hypothetical protein
MRIESSDITMGSTRRVIERHDVRETLRLWWGGETERSAGSGRNSIAREGTERPRLSQKAKSYPKAGKVKGAKEQSCTRSTMDSKLYVIKTLIEKLTGKKVTVLDMSALNQAPEDAQINSEEAPPGDEAPTREGWGIDYRRRESHFESEHTVFAAEGIIKTKAGQEIKFELDLQMSRKFMSEETTLFMAGDAARVDPLVLNFDGSAAELTSTKFTFDLDSDGREDRISFVRPGSGLLVLDRDKDGKIKDGSELFGPTTGNGFLELAAYDEDGNNWIDENDRVYNELSLWTKDIQGNDLLSSLRARRIGAIYLRAIDTTFDLRDAANQLHGEIWRSGIYLEGNGDVKTIQQINMTV